MTLEPGIYEPEEAPWWEFTCQLDETTATVTAQWMGEAAQQFAEQLAAKQQALLLHVEVKYLDLDGMSGLYGVMLTEQIDELLIVVERGEMVDKPQLEGG